MKVLALPALICPFNLHPIFSFEKMGAFATLEKNRVEFNLNFFQGGKSIHLFKTENRVQIKGAYIFYPLQKMSETMFSA